jgi:hypothetical protein
MECFIWVQNLIFDIKKEQRMRVVKRRVLSGKFGPNKVSNRELKKIS